MIPFYWCSRRAAARLPPHRHKKDHNKNTIGKMVFVWSCLHYQ